MIKTSANTADGRRKKNGATLRTIALCAAALAVVLPCGCTTDSISDALGAEVSSIMTYYTLSVGTSSGGSASISRAIYNGHEVSNPKEMRYRVGTTVYVSASANSGYRFTGWSGASTSTSSSIDITMSGNQTLTANFKRFYTLSTSANPRDGGYVSPSGNTSHIEGETVTVTAQAYLGYRFTGWSGASSSSNDDISVTMNGDRTLTASFEQIAYTLTVNRNNTSYGTVTQSSSSGIIGTQISISATTNSGYLFRNWAVTSGSATIADPSSEATTATLGSSNATITANFKLQMQTESFTHGGQTYKTVKIGSQWWMAENLNYQIDNSWCYNNDNSNCAKYGRLYIWDAAKNACPSGWHLPSSWEWGMLVDYAGGRNTAGNVLKSTSGWSWNSGASGNGTDEFDFSALPGGYYYAGRFDNVGNGGGWWSASESESSNAYRWSMGYNHNLVVDDAHGKTIGFSVRCVKDN